MSIDVQRAVIARLEGDSQLSAMLARDPNDSSQTLRPAIFAASFNLSGPVYPSVTLRCSTEQPESSFRPAMPGPYIPIEHERYDVEIWSQQPDGGAEVDAIKQRIDAQLHYTRFVTAGGAHVFFASRVTAVPSSYTEALRCWFGAFSYYLRVERPLVNI